MLCLVDKEGGRASGERQSEKNAMPRFANRLDPSSVARYGVPHLLRNDITLASSAMLNAGPGPVQETATAT
jgi:hypothetical protein